MQQTYSIHRPWRDGESMTPKVVESNIPSLREALDRSNAVAGYVVDSDGAIFAPDGTLTDPPPQG